MITDWHHEACRAMTNGDLEGHILLSHPHTNCGSQLNTSFYIGKKNMKKVSENPEYAKMRHICGMGTSF